MKNKLINLSAIIIIGGLSGILGVQIFLPWLAGFSFFSRFDWIAQSRNGTTIINRAERIVVTENQALEEAIDKAQKIVVGVTAQKTEKTVGGQKVMLAKPEIPAQGTGFIVSSDGLIVATENLVPQNAQKVLVVLGNKNIEAEIKKRDKNSGLVLLKISESNLPVLPFSDGNLRLGEKVFLLAESFREQSSVFTGLSIVKQISPSLLIDFRDKDIDGSPIFNIKAEIVGVNSVDAKEQNKIISISKIKDLLK